MAWFLCSHHAPGSQVRGFTLGFYCAGDFTTKFFNDSCFYSSFFICLFSFKTKTNQPPPPHTHTTTILTTNVSQLVSWTQEVLTHVPSWLCIETFTCLWTFGGNQTNKEKNEVPAGRLMIYRYRTETLDDVHQSVSKHAEVKHAFLWPLQVTPNDLNAITRKACPHTFGHKDWVLNWWSSGALPGLTHAWQIVDSSF